MRIKNKFKDKQEFTNRGVYFLTDGEFKGCFVLNLTELDNDKEKMLAVFPEGTTMTVDRTKILEMFESGFFEYVETLPKKVYKVCLAQHTGGTPK